MTELEADPPTPIAVLALAASPVIYLVSFALPVFDGKPEPTRGATVFLTGLVYPLIFLVIGLLKREPGALLPGAFLIPWLANVAYWVALYRLYQGKRRWVVPLAFLAQGLGLTIVVVWLCFWWTMPGHIPHPPTPFVFREGYWFWLGSMALLVFGAWTPREGRMSRAKLGKLARAWDD